MDRINLGLLCSLYNGGNTMGFGKHGRNGLPMQCPSSKHISQGPWKCTNMDFFFGFNVIVASFVPTQCPVVVGGVCVLKSARANLLR